MLLIEAVTACLRRRDASLVPVDRDRACWRVYFGSSAGLAGRLRLVSESSYRSENQPTPRTPECNPGLRGARFAGATGTT